MAPSSASPCRPEPCVRIGDLLRRVSGGSVPRWGRETAPPPRRSSYVTRGGDISCQQPRTDMRTARCVRPRRGPAAGEAAARSPPPPPLGCAPTDARHAKYRTRRHATHGDATPTRCSCHSDGAYVFRGCRARGGGHGPRNTPRTQFYRVTIFVRELLRLCAALHRRLRASGSSHRK
jgi:hypothetical protein